jgi:hypothetical protein
VLLEKKVMAQLAIHLKTRVSIVQTAKEVQQERRLVLSVLLEQKPSQDSRVQYAQ